jgi:uroporphyrinogen-III synthase
MITALITRPLAEVAETACLLADKGFSTITDSMLTIRYRLDAAAELAEALQSPLQVIVVTSNHAVRALARITKRRDLPLVAVGTATTATAHQEGFMQVATAGGNVELLCNYIAQRYAPQAGKIIYLSADVITMDISASLIAAGFDATHIIGYTTNEATELNASTLILLTSSAPAIVLFYSSRTAQIFTRLAARYSPAALTAFTLSPAITASLNAHHWQHIYTAEQPTQDSLLARIESVYRPKI